MTSLRGYLSRYNPKNEDLATDYQSYDAPLPLSPPEKQVLHLSLAYSALGVTATSVKLQIRSRISQNKSFGTALSVIWNIAYFECFIIFAPIFISFSLIVSRPSYDEECRKYTLYFFKVLLVVLSHCIITITSYDWQE